MDNANDVTAELGNEAAAEDTRAAAEGEALETGPSFIGDFDSYEAVRDFFDGPLEPGDYAVVNGGLVRVKPDRSFEVIVSNLVDEYAPPADHTERFSRDLEGLERVVLGAEFETGSLLGNVVSVLVELYKNRPRAWSELSQLEQRDLGKQLEAQAKTIIRKIVRVVAEGEEISVHGKLERYTHAGAFDLKISATSDEEAALQLFRMQGHEVIITSADAGRFVNEAPAIEGEPDQRGLPFADEEENPGEAYVAPADDSDLAGDADEEDETVAELSEADAALAAIDGDELEEPVEEYAGRSPEPGEEAEAGEVVEAEHGPGEPAAPFEEADEEELASQTARTSTEQAQRAADYTGPREPADAVPGESWHNTSDDRVKYKHPNGKWYVAAPKADDVEAWKAAQEPAAEEVAELASETGFPDEPAS